MEEKSDNCWKRLRTIYSERNFGRTLNRIFITKCDLKKESGDHWELDRNKCYIGVIKIELRIFIKCIIRTKKAEIRISAEYRGLKQVEFGLEDPGKNYMVLVTVLKLQARF